jgi:hypothetical protein
MSASKLGKYNEDEDIERYERIFKLHTQSKDGKDFNFYNILNKIEFPENIDPEYIETYTVPSRLPLTTISYNIYGDITSWWIIFLMNKDKLPELFFSTPGIKLQYIEQSFLTLIYNQITRDTIYNGRHF